MRREDNDKFWIILNWLDDMDDELSTSKRQVENMLTEIRHKRSRLMDYILDDKNDVKED